MTGLRQQLLTLASDVQRLVPAGATAAAHDERLRMRVESLEQWAHQVPALGPVIESLRGVFHPDRVARTRGFLSLIASVRQIWALLTASGVPGEVEQVEDRAAWTTSTPSANLYTLTEALRKGGTGLQQALDDALTTGHATDLRLLEAWLDAPPHRLQQTMRFMKALRPKCGPLLVEGLRSRFKSPDHAHRRANLLYLICNLDTKAGAECCRYAIEEGPPELRVTALQHYVKLAPSQAEETAVRLLDASQPVKVRAEAVSVLHRRRIPSARFVALLEQNLTDGAAWQVCQLAHATFAAAEKEAVIAVRALAASLGSSAVHVREQCAKVLGQLGRHSIPVVPLLIEALLGEQERFHTTQTGPHILTALRQIGQPLGPIIEAMFAYEERWRNWHCGSAHWQHQWSEQRLRNALVELAKKQPEAIGIIAEKCRSPGWGFRREALEVICQLGHAAAGAVPCLVEMLSDRIHRNGAIRALGKIGPAARSAAPALREAMGGRTACTRLLAAVAQVRVGVRDRAVVPVLVQALESKSCPLPHRREAAEALGTLGALARPAIGALRQITRQPNRDLQLRTACKQAIEKITGRLAEGRAPRRRVH